MAKRMIHLAFACDAWKGRDSMRLLMATTSTAKLYRMLSSRIEAGDICYGDEHAPAAKQAEEFRKDLSRDLSPGESVKDKLKYCYLEDVEDGQEL